VPSERTPSKREVMYHYCVPAGSSFLPMHESELSGIFFISAEGKLKFITFVCDPRSFHTYLTAVANAERRG